MGNIRKWLFLMQDTVYRDFQAKLIPSIDPGKMIGVRTPQLRKLARELIKSCPGGDLEAFYKDLPHTYFDEDQLHAFLISEMKDYNTCMDHLEHFLPFIDNWATCDQLAPKVLAGHKEELLEKIRQWIHSDRTYTVRFAIGMLMKHFLGEDYKDEYADLVASVRSDEYYINMMIAWYFATALAKQYDSVLPYIEEHRLDAWTHNKAIQKAIESYRIIPDQKTYLRTLKIKGGKDGRSQGSTLQQTGSFGDVFP